MVEVVVATTEHVLGSICVYRRANRCGAVTSEWVARVVCLVALLLLLLRRLLLTGRHVPGRGLVVHVPHRRLRWGLLHRLRSQLLLRNLILRQRSRLRLLRLALVTILRRGLIGLLLCLLVLRLLLLLLLVLWRLLVLLWWRLLLMLLLLLLVLRGLLVLLLRRLLLLRGRHVRLARTQPQRTAVRLVTDLLVLRHTRRRGLTHCIWIGSRLGTLPAARLRVQMGVGVERHRHRRQPRVVTVRRHLLVAVRVVTDGAARRWFAVVGWRGRTPAPPLRCVRYCPVSDATLCSTDTRTVHRTPTRPPQ